MKIDIETKYNIGDKIYAPRIKTEKTPHSWCLKYTPYVKIFIINEITIDVICGGITTISYSLISHDIVDSDYRCLLEDDIVKFEDYNSALEYACGLEISGEDISALKRKWIN